MPFLVTKMKYYKVSGLAFSL